MQGLPHAVVASMLVQSIPSKGLIRLMAIGAGAAVAALYYSQPLLDLIAADFDASPGAVGLIPTCAQLGYAAGILLMSPFGDRYDRRRVIAIKSLVLTLALVLAALSPNLLCLGAATLAVGLSATLAQDIVPGAAALSPPDQRGRIVGRVMTGLLTGILLSRVASGALAQFLGWRAVFWAASFGVAGVAVALWRGLPPFAATTRQGWPALMGSLWGLWRDHCDLRRAACAQGLLSAGFSAFWSLLALMLARHYGMGAGQAGLFGLAGAAGALAAPFAGRFADRLGFEAVARVGAGCALVAFAAMFALPALSRGGQIGLLIFSAVLFDFGVQAALVAHQTLVYGIAPEARSRLNALLFTAMFLGMASGSAAGAWIFARWDWTGVVALASLCALGALLLRLAAGRK